MKLTPSADWMLHHPACTGLLFALASLVGGYAIVFVLVVLMRLLL